MKSAKKIVWIIVAVFVVIGFTQVDFSSNKQPDQTASNEQLKPLLETASNTSGLSSFVTAVKTAALTEKLNSGGPYTVFVPNDKAFAKMSEQEYAQLMNPQNKEQLEKLLKNYIVEGKMYASDFEDGQTLTTLGRQSVTVSLGDDGVWVNDAEIVESDVEASNGVIHIVDAMLTPTQNDSAQTGTNKP